MGELDDYGIDPHPLGHLLDPGDWDRQGHCICGDQLPAQRDWARAGMDWANILCDNCGRGYVDEEEFFAIYDAEQAADAGDTSEWKVRSVKGIAMRSGPDESSIRAWAEVLDKKGTAHG